MASLYEEALSAAREEGPAAVREHSVSNHSALPDERTLQLLLLEGVFGTSFTDDSGRDVHILDFGNWNKSAGPDFLNARICINGVPQSGDIELDPTPEDWERHGHGSNPGFNGVVLHLACAPSRRKWFTRNARHERVPLAVIPPRCAGAVRNIPFRQRPGTPLPPLRTAGIHGSGVSGNTPPISGSLQVPEQAPPPCGTRQIRRRGTGPF